MLVSSFVGNVMVTFLILVLYQLIDRQQKKKTVAPTATATIVVDRSKQNNKNKKNEQEEVTRDNEADLPCGATDATGSSVPPPVVVVGDRPFPPSLNTQPQPQQQPSSSSTSSPSSHTPPLRVGVLIATQKGTARSFAHKFFSSFLAARFQEADCLTPELIDLGLYHSSNNTQQQQQEASSSTFTDLENLSDCFDVVVIYASTYTGGTCPERCQKFDQHWRDLVGDHRVPRDVWKKVQFAVFGLGDVAYSNKAVVMSAAATATNRSNEDPLQGGRNPNQEEVVVDVDGTAPSKQNNNNSTKKNLFCAYSRQLAEDIKALGGTLLTPAVYADEARAQTLNTVFGKAVLTYLTKRIAKRKKRLGKAKDDDEDDAMTTVSMATTTATSRTTTTTTAKRSSGGGASRAAAAKSADGAGGGCCKNNTNNNNEVKRQAGDNGNDEDEGCGCAAQEDEDEEDSSSNLSHSDDDDEEEGKTGGGGDVEDLIQESKKELLYPRLRQNLEKQNYRLVGSHSAVKLCRWTKSMLRGRGGCYKHTFYNISSFQCMEATPSLACANKCVFCWRHHTNPVARSFSWTHDDAAMLVEGMLREHRQMIKQMRGVPGVVEARLQEAMRVAHCALSLVGEPILYPEMNLFARLLHQHRVSTFLVTNAQFPDQMALLTEPITQFYLSIDASTKAELHKIDRPVLEDFWERMLRCVFYLRFRKQRTVFRLTLVNDYNMVSMRQYATLVQVGMPDFIEVKGVTYSGASAASNLTIKHSPFHNQVVSFCQELCLAIAANEAITETAKIPYKEYDTAFQKEKKMEKKEEDDEKKIVELCCDVGNADEVVAWMIRELDPSTTTTNTTTTTDDDGLKEDDSHRHDDDHPPRREAGELDALYRAVEPQLVYQIACEHEHSCCMLIARSVFRRDIPSITPLPQRHSVSPTFLATASSSSSEGASSVENHQNDNDADAAEGLGATTATTTTPLWNTWINYDQYFSYTNQQQQLPPPHAAEVVEEEQGEETKSSSQQQQRRSHSTAAEAFTALDYALPTPSWAVFRSAEKGFDPKESRHKK